MMAFSFFITLFAIIVVMIGAMSKDSELIAHSKKHLPKFELKEFIKRIGILIDKRLEKNSSISFGWKKNFYIPIDDSMIVPLKNLCIYFPRMITDRDDPIKLKRNDIEAFVDFHEKVELMLRQKITKAKGIKEEMETQMNNKGKSVEMEFSRSGLITLSLVFRAILDWMSKRSNSFMSIELMGFKKCARLDCRTYLRTAVFSNTPPSLEGIGGGTVKDALKKSFGMAINSYGGGEFLPSSKRIKNYFIEALDGIYKSFKDIVDTRKPLIQDGKECNVIIPSDGESIVIRHLLCLMPIFLPESELKDNMTFDDWTLFLDLSKIIMNRKLIQSIKVERRALLSFLRILAGARDDLSGKRSQDIYRALGLLPCEDYNTFRQDIESMIMMRLPSPSPSLTIPSLDTSNLNIDKQKKELPLPLSQLPSLSPPIKIDLIGEIRKNLGNFSGLLREALSNQITSKFDFLNFNMKNVPLKSIMGMLNAMYVILPSNPRFLYLFPRKQWDKFFELCDQLIKSSDQTIVIIKKTDAELFSDIIQMIIGFETWNDQNVRDLVTSNLRSDWRDFLKNFLPPHPVATASIPPSAPISSNVTNEKIETHSSSSQLSSSIRTDPKSFENHGIKGNSHSIPSSMSNFNSHALGGQGGIAESMGSNNLVYKCNHIRILSQIEVQTEYMINSLQNGLKQIPPLETIAINLGIPQFLVLSNLFRLISHFHHLIVGQFTEIEGKKLNSLKNVCNQAHQQIRNSTVTFKTIKMKRNDAQLMSRFLNTMALNIANTSTRTFLNVLKGFDQERERNENIGHEHLDL